MEQYTQLTLFDTDTEDDEDGEGFLYSESLLRNDIFAVEKNVHGAWAIYGSIGVHQYCFRTKREAIRMYLQECKNTEFFERKT